jgi:hypothetical protein
MRFNTTYQRNNQSMDRRVSSIKEDDELGNIKFNYCTKPKAEELSLLVTERTVFLPGYS